MIPRTVYNPFEKSLKINSWTIRIQTQMNTTSKSHVLVPEERKSRIVCLYLRISEGNLYQNLLPDSLVWVHMLNTHWNMFWMMIWLSLILPNIWNHLLRNRFIFKIRFLCKVCSMMILLILMLRVATSQIRGIVGMHLLLACLEDIKVLNRTRPVIV